MFSTWMKLSLDAARLGFEMQTVMALRMLKLAQGGAAATTEAQRMMTEKGVAFAEAAATLATGGSMNKVVRRVRSPRQPEQAPPLSLTSRSSCPDLPACAEAKLGFGRYTRPA